MVQNKEALAGDGWHGWSLHGVVKTSFREMVREIMDSGRSKIVRKNKRERKKKWNRAPRSVAIRLTFPWRTNPGLYC